MRYYKCKCGTLEGWGSDGPGRCVICHKCGTTMATNPHDHKTETEPHRFLDSIFLRAKKDAPDGYEIYRLCMGCHHHISVSEEERNKILDMRIRDSDIEELQIKDFV